jgi:hypothetical protein
MLRNISADSKRHEQKPESESLGHHLCESQFGLIDQVVIDERSRARWCERCEHLDTACGSPDTINIRSDNVKYALGGTASMIGSQSGHTHAKTITHREFVCRRPGDHHTGAGNCLRPTWWVLYVQVLRTNCKRMCGSCDWQELEL